MPTPAPAGELAESVTVPRLPTPALRDVVRRYVGYQQRNVPVRAHRGLPSGSLTLIISLADPIRLTALPDPAQPPGDFASCVGGLHAAPVVIHQDRFQSGIHVELDPLGAPRLLGVPARELSSTVVDLADLPGRWARGLADRLVAAPTWTQRFGILNQVLTAAVAERRDPDAEVEWAWRRLLDTGGAISIDGLAGEVGWSRRHLSERFRLELGLAPKQAARVVRFERSYTLLQRAVRIDLADLATTCGYHDQAHMTNEWRTLAGCTPGAWIADELPFLQYSGEPADAP